MKRNRIMRYLVFIVVIIMTIGGISPLAYAGKPGATTGVVITTPDIPETIVEGEYIDFQVTAKYGSSKEVIWSSSPNLRLISGPTVVKKQVVATFRFSQSTPATYTEYVKVRDSYGYEDTLWATFTILGTVPENKPPVAENLELTTNEDQTISGTIIATDPDGDSLTTAITYAPSHGSAYIQGLNVTYTPDLNYYGSDSFVVTVFDGRGGEDTANVSITIIPADEPLRYVALGDSIPSGIYYTSLWNYIFGGTNSYSYVEQLADQLKVESSNFVDASVSGYNTVDVFNQINTMTEVIRNADVITLCVGANDIMDAAGRDTSGLLKYSINWSIADSGRDNFEFYWWQLIDCIENLNPDVTLVVMTIYNPYRTSDSYYSDVDPYFSSSTGELGLNYIIKNTPALYDSGASDIFADTFNYKVVDIYKAFNDHINKDSLTGFYSSFCDPHPNQAGQNLIFTEHMKAF